MREFDFESKNTKSHLYAWNYVHWCLPCSNAYIHSWSFLGRHLELNYIHDVCVSLQIEYSMHGKWTAYWFLLGWIRLSVSLSVWGCLSIDIQLWKSLVAYPVIILPLSRFISLLNTRMELHRELPPFTRTKGLQFDFWTLCLVFTSITLYAR